MGCCDCMNYIAVSFCSDIHLSDFTHSCTGFLNPHSGKTKVRYLRKRQRRRIELVLTSAAAAVRGKNAAVCVPLFICINPTISFPTYAFPISRILAQDFSIPIAAKQKSDTCTNGSDGESNSSSRPLPRPFGARMLRYVHLGLFA